MALGTRADSDQTSPIQVQDLVGRSTVQLTTANDQPQYVAYLTSRNSVSIDISVLVTFASPHLPRYRNCLSVVHIPRN